MLVLSSSISSSTLLDSKSKKSRGGGSTRLVKQRSFEDVFSEGHRLEWEALQKKQTAFVLAGTDTRDDVFISGWRCSNRECSNRDRDSLVMTDDKAAMVCPECGLVDGLAQPISATFEAHLRTEHTTDNAEDSNRLGRFDSMLGTSSERKAKRISATASTSVGVKDADLKRKQVALINERGKEIQRQQSGLSDTQLRRRDRVVAEISSIFKAGGRNVDRCPIFDSSCHLATSQFARGIAHSAVCNAAHCKVGFAARRFTTIAREAITQTIQASLERAETAPIAGMTKTDLESATAAIREIIKPYCAHPSSGMVRNELMALKCLSPSQLLEPCACLLPILVTEKEDTATATATDTLFEAKMNIAFESIESLQFAPAYVIDEARQLSTSVGAYAFLASVRTTWPADLVAVMVTLALLLSLGGSRGSVSEYSRRLRSQMDGLAKNERIGNETVARKLNEIDKIIQRDETTKTTNQEPAEFLDPWA